MPRMTAPKERTLHGNVAGTLCQRSLLHGGNFGRNRQRAGRGALCVSALQQDLGAAKHAVAPPGRGAQPGSKRQRPGGIDVWHVGPGGGRSAGRHGVSRQRSGAYAPFRQVSEHRTGDADGGSDATRNADSRQDLGDRASPTPCRGNLGRGFGFAAIESVEL